MAVDRNNHRILWVIVAEGDSAGQRAYSRHVSTMDTSLNRILIVPQQLKHEPVKKSVNPDLYAFWTPIQGN